MRSLLLALVMHVWKKSEAVQYLRGCLLLAYKCGVKAQPCMAVVTRTVVKYLLFKSPF